MPRSSNSKLRLLLLIRCRASLGGIIAWGLRHRTVKTVTVSILFLSHEERAETLAAPLINPELAGLSAALGQLAVQGIEVVYCEG